MREIRVFETPRALAEGAAEELASLAEEAIGERGKFSLVLAGGNTPRLLYERLAQAPFRDQIDWARVEIFFGDERCVPPEHPDSNFRMANESLLGQVSIPQEQIHRIRGEIEPVQAAREYEAELKAAFRSPQPAFDLVLLGLGEDGHTASLFPGSTALKHKKHWVTAVEHHRPPPPLVTRITLTLPVLNAAREAWFLVSGGGKANILRRILDTEGETDLLPAQQVQPVSGELVFLVDKAAWPEGR